MAPLLVVTGLFVAVGMTAGCGAHSTEYVPKRADRLALTMKDGKLELRKGRVTTPVKEAELDAFGRVRTGAADLLACDDASLDEFLTAQEHFELAQLLYWGGTAAVLVAMLFVPAVWAVVWVAVFVLAASDVQTHLGMARAIDAMNRHNDAATCTGGRPLDREEPASPGPASPAAPTGPGPSVPDPPAALPAEERAR